MDKDQTIEPTYEIGLNVEKCSQSVTIADLLRPLL